MELVSDLSIRPAGASDVDTVLAFWPAAGAPPSATDEAESVRCAVAEGRLLLAELGGELVGTVYAGFDGWRGELYRLAVRPDHRRRGIASALVAEGHRYLDRRGAKRISVLVERADEQAVKFWTAAGYGLDDGMARFVRPMTAESQRRTAGR
jgi:ribosomal protein S18 acetylase RimI-like enzyme